MNSDLKKFIKILFQLLSPLVQLLAFISYSYLLLGNLKQAIGLGYMVCLIWWELISISKNLKKN